MLVELDNLGRVKLPKRILEDLDLKPGRSLDVKQDEDRIVLKPTRRPYRFKREGHLLVFTGRLVGSMEEALQKVREERMREILRIDSDERDVR